MGGNVIQILKVKTEIKKKKKNHGFTRTGTGTRVHGYGRTGMGSRVRGSGFSWVLNQKNGSGPFNTRARVPVYPWLPVARARSGPGTGTVRSGPGTGTGGPVRVGSVGVFLQH